MLNNLTMDSQIEGEKDQLATGGILETAIHRGNIKLAYLEKSSGGALSFNIHVDVGGGHIYREALWITSGDAKGNKNYYETQDGTRKYLPGFMIANSIVQHALGTTIDKLEPEEKTIKLYDYDAKKELPTTRPVIVELTNKPIALGILKIRKNKQVKNDNGNYVDSAEEQFINEINKVFDAETLATTTEKAADDKPEFHTRWAEKYNDLVDRYKPIEGGSQPAQGGQQYRQVLLVRKLQLQV